MMNMSGFGNGKEWEIACIKRQSKGEYKDIGEIRMDYGAFI